MILTNAMRETVARDAVNAAFDERRKTLAEVEAALALKLYCLFVPAVNRELMAKLPDNYFATRTEIEANVGGRHIKLVASVPCKVPYAKSGGRIGTLLPDDPMTIAIDEHLRNKATLAEDEKKARAVLDAMLKSVTTVEKLRALWPDGEPHYRNLAPKATATVPALIVEDVNRMLGLPKAA